MMIEPNPIGTPQQLQPIDDKVKEFVTMWDSGKVKTSWWKPWEKVKLSQVTSFLISCLDDLICIVDALIPAGEDKKATVLAAIVLLYDYIVPEILPIFLKPFSGKIKQYIIYTLCSISIDWIVKKYRTGWTKNTEG
jgi:hypothetical protein